MACLTASVRQISRHLDSMCGVDRLAGCVERLLPSVRRATTVVSVCLYVGVDCHNVAACQ